MNRAMLERERILKPFSSPAERKLLKCERRRLRHGFEMTRGVGAASVENQYLNQLIEVRERIAKGRPVRIDRMVDLLEVFKVTSMWREVLKGEQQCDMTRISLSYRTHNFAIGCHNTPQPQERASLMHLFEPLDIVLPPNNFKLLFCPVCHDRMLRSSLQVWRRFVAHFAIFGRSIPELMPIYLDYKRVPPSARFSPSLRENLSHLELRNIEEISEDEEDGESAEVFEGVINPYSDLRHLEQEDPEYVRVPADWEIPGAQAMDVDHDLLLREMH